MMVMKTGSKRRAPARFAPPGYYKESWPQLYFAVLVLEALFSTGYFATEFYSAYDSLFLETRKGLVLIDGATILSFKSVAFGGFIGYPVLAVGLVVFGCYLFSCYFHGSRSIYLMRRLPDGRELWRRVVTLPLVGLIVELLTAGALLLLYYVLYVVITPAGCLP